MSQTLRAILDNWLGPIPNSSEVEVSELPFNIENFCRDNDEILQEKDQQISNLKEECERLYQEYLMEAAKNDNSILSVD